ncbi:MAG TPA: type II toxin-antitoxin system prevent-host-death family antitoxin [Thermoanaerobaculia bacterium]|nr:type II toxin-antitoxin system prevent-host-death family antitoxin [Thermoanaerobaculia bacterium]
MRPKLSRVNVAEAKKSLSELLGRVAYGRETITIVKRGRPMARLVPVPPEDSATLAEVKGWLDDDHPFFKNINEIVAERHQRRPRRPPRLAD